MEDKIGSLLFTAAMYHVIVKADLVWEIADARISSKTKHKKFQRLLIERAVVCVSTHLPSTPLIQVGILLAPCNN